MEDDQNDYQPVPRGRGRPRGRVTSPGSRVTTFLRQEEHDRLIRLANARETSVSSLVRQLLILRLP